MKMTTRTVVGSAKCMRVVRMRKDGMPWRKIEKRLRLNPAHGMTAFRCFKKAKARRSR
jgi:hypothetical protein